MAVLADRTQIRDMQQVEIDTLKPYVELLEPDTKQKYFAVVNRETGEARPITLRDKHEAVVSIMLASDVPQEIREHFDTARNLYVYSWFVYRFNQVAELHAFSSLEFALKKKCGDSPMGLKKLLERAVERGWILDSGFRYFRPVVDEAASENEIDRDNPDAKDVQDYCRTLIDMLPFIRNELAHGSRMLHPNALTTLEIVADLINQLFERK